MGKGQGNDWRLYVGTSAPGVDFDTGDAAWNVVGFSTDSGLSTSKDLIDAADKNNPYSSSYLAGRKDTEVSETVFAEEGHAVTDEGQEDLWNTYTDDDTTLYFLLSNGVTGDQAFQGETYVSDLDFTATDNDMVEVDVTLQVTGSLKRGAHV